MEFVCLPLHASCVLQENNIKTLEAGECSTSSATRTGHAHKHLSYVVVERMELHASFIPPLSSHLHNFNRLCMRRATTWGMLRDEYWYPVLPLFRYVCDPTTKGLFSPNHLYKTDKREELQQTEHHCNLSRDKGSHAARQL